MERKPTIPRTAESKPDFTYVNGYALTVSDLGDTGIVLTLEGGYEMDAGILLPSEVTTQLTRWLNRVIGSEQTRLSQMPADIADVLSRARRKDSCNRGDSCKIEACIKILRPLVEKTETEFPAEARVRQWPQKGDE